MAGSKRNSEVCLTLKQFLVRLPVLMDLLGDLSTQGLEQFCLELYL